MTRPRPTARARGRHSPGHDAGRHGFRLDRRSLLAGLAGLFGARVSGARREEEYRTLQEPVELELAQLEEPWQPVPFRGWCDAPQAAAGEALLHGAALRLPPAEGGELKAYCLICPHEICGVDFIEDASSVPKEAGPMPAHPLFLCPCHFSVFDPAADGGVLAGPAARGLYRFGFEIQGNRLLIDRVEEGVVR